MDPGLWADLVEAYESFTDSEIPQEREQALDWFQHTWPKIHDAVHVGLKQSEPYAVSLVHMTAPFLFRIADWTQLEELSRLGFELSVKLQLATDCAKLLNRLGVSLQHLQRDESAEQVLIQAESVAKMLDDKALEASALAHRGQILGHVGEAAEAATLLHRAASIYRAENDSLGEARTLGDLASISADLGDEVGADDYNERSRQIFRSLGDLDGEARAVWKLADGLVRRRDLDGAVRLLEEATDLFEAIPAPASVAEARFAAAQLLHELGDPSAAIRYARIARGRTSPATIALREAISEFLEYVEAELALRQLSTAGSDDAARKVISAHPVLMTEQALDLALQSRADSDEAGIAANRLLMHPKSAAARRSAAEWQEVQLLAGENRESLPPTLQSLILQLFVPPAGGDISELLLRIIALAPEGTFPGVHGRYLLHLAFLKAADAKSAGDFEDAMDTATEAAVLLRRGGADDESAAALVQIGASWRQRRTGDLRHNADRALGSLRQALTIYRRPSHPEQWAGTLCNIANVYGQYPVDRKRNLRRAANRHLAALTVFTPDRHSDAYATALSNLGMVLSAPAMAAEPDNLEAARRYLTRSLRLSNEPSVRAAVLLNLSLCYRTRVQGDPDANLDFAVRYARQAFDLLQGLDMPIEMSDAGTAVADALSMQAHRANYSDGLILAESIKWYRRALAALPAEQAPLAHAATSGNLATTLGLLPDAPEAFREAILLHRSAIRTYRDYGDLAEECRALYNLATTLGRQSSPDHDEIVSLYEQSLVGRHIDDARSEWGESVTQLARALLERNADGDVTRARSLLEQAVSSMGPDANLDYLRDAWSLLGRASGRQGAWNRAAQALQSAVTAANARYLAAVLSSGQQVELSRLGGLPREAGYALARSGQASAAAAVIESARARDLARLLERDRADLSALEEAAPGAATNLRAAVSHLAAVEARQRATLGGDEEDRRQLRAMLIDAQAEFKVATEAVRALPGFVNFGHAPQDSAEQVARRGIPVVYLVTAEYGSVALVVTPNGETEAVFGSLTEDELIRTLAGARTLRDDGLLNRVLDLLGSRFIGALAQRLVDLNVTEAFFVPTGLHGALPVHAACYQRDGRSRHLLDDVEISYAPSARTLLLSDPQNLSPTAMSLFGVAEPLPTMSRLPAAAAEVNTARRLFPGTSDALYGHAATKAAFKAGIATASHVHLACHGSYDAEEPLKSCLYLAEGEKLTLKELFDGRWCETVSVLVASACETAVSDIIRTPDEAMGLPAGLLYSGASTVIGSLWSIYDQSTALLISRFYTNHFHGDPDDEEGPMPVARALNRAQRWMRDASAAELNRFAQDMHLPELPPLTSDRPLADLPTHWAAFVVVGASRTHSRQ